LTPLPSVLVELLEPFCRSCRKPLRNDCNAAVDVDASVAVVPDAVLTGVPDVPDVLPAVALAPVPAVVPPRSATSWENAVFNADRVLEEILDPLEPVDVALTSWLSERSLTSEVKAAIRPCCAY
jgi:hypothetical protein